jgi:hypothetical protein
MNMCMTLNIRKRQRSSMEMTVTLLQLKGGQIIFRLVAKANTSLFLHKPAAVANNPTEPLTEIST